ncbi:site-specific DNA-methyltransferase [Lactobacillus helveticus]|uniref:site-specific DNA-methyltransferase n=1 Tax=Lactobacillus helveticus TaxID=1587 RepID=UPI001563F438|nr:site-specific DNA-methyltransferase [Lactobacillus helveticus]NRO45517.1 DNA adenine methyltransferase YhdJ [Lactobacillus helveticus]
MEIEPKIMSQVKSILGEFGNKYLTSKGSLKRNSVINDLDKFDHVLMTKLFKDPLIHKNYVEKIADAEVFKLNQFVEMFEYKNFWEDSYTKFTNKIGLTANGKFIDESADVVLDFPFKDTVLKAGMTKEDLDKDESADEPFLNEIIAKPEIDELLEPKIFVNAKKYDQNGEQDVTKFHDNNLVIKGNNLIALYSIKEKYAQKVKFIYLDPPYNTGSDSFEYNDKFNQASWLTFIKSRLEICQDLLKEDGCIYISIDENEYAYLKVLMDEIFGEDNDLITFHMQVRYTNKSLNEKNDFQPVMEYGIFYAKNKQRFVPNKPYEEYDVSKFRFAIKELGTPDETVTLGGKKVEIFKPGNYKINKVSPSIKGLKETWASGSVLKGNTSGKFFDQFLSKRKGEDGLKVLYKVYGIGEDGLGFRYFTGPKKATSIRGKFYSGIPLNKLKQIKTGEARKYKPIVNYYDFSGAVGNIRQEGGVSLNGGKKPEKMLNMLLNISTNKGDIVLDPFSGSGTTAAVCLKTGRKFVAIEQIDNQIELIKARLVNCINGDKTGLSKAVDWQGGGNFVYTELMEKNQIFVDEINQATNEDDLNKAYQHMKKSADFDFRVDLDKYENDAERKALPFEEQKQLLVKLLDKNQLYYNFNNIDDADVRDLISDKDYQFNQSFYGKRD